ncbi:phage major tail protein, TP901-1 family [Weizmannia sp. CD-2023]|uniref:phage major tail protein, TP901-1 family n=1 Tax=Heyndrickxia TaxID=2837504 RepID=UPI002E1BE83E|nr:phage major tail protein, TP901-1 family [Weizmannia sp. CD-2023]MED4840396.1 phage major tail protein, TP901-1 family [Weizmannia sp. CD-2023]MED4899711.1 phage major tail protein, TP901-1 family [Weizmannia sp. CD-2023]
MAGQKIAGVDVLIYADVNGTKTLVGGQSGAKLNREANLIETTTKDAEGWAENITGVLSWSIESDGYVVVDDAALDALETAFLDRKEVDVEVRMPNGKMYYGSAFISEFPLDAPQDDALTYSLKFAGNGKLEKGSIPTTA